MRRPIWYVNSAVNATEKCSIFILKNYILITSVLYNLYDNWSKSSQKSLKIGL